MPVYEYECESCARVFDHYQKITEPNLSVCPTCGGPVHKLISRSSFRLSGSGWYVTDYCKRNEGSKTNESEGTPKESSSSSNVSKGSD
ncbi:MAG: zinc ribbon domain-containing protein [Deltaproteobacteria bacterium]